ncbi:MAG TPA: DUF4203 domain-containing protein [Ktedonobacteraceae bacterium]|jgi:hypothetical protein
MAFQDFLIGALVLLVGALFCFAGYRFFRILITIWGFFAGFNLGTAAMTALFNNAFLQTTTGIVLGIVIGLVFAALAYFFYYFAVVLLGATAGYDLGSGFIGAIGLNNPGFIAVIVGVALAVVFALVILLFNLPKLLIMVFTALGGAVAMLAGLLILLGQVKTAYLQYGDAVALVRASWFWTIVAIVIAVVGFLAQWRTNQDYTLVWSESSTSQVQ